MGKHHTGAPLSSSWERGCWTGKSHPKDPIPARLPHPTQMAQDTLQCHQPSQGTAATSLQPTSACPNWEDVLRACIKSQQCLCLRRQTLLQGMGRLSFPSIKAHKKAIVSKVAQNYVCSGNAAPSIFKAACLILSSSI